MSHYITPSLYLRKLQNITETDKVNRVGSIVTVSKWEDVKKVEEFEDCFILEFDPTQLINGGKPNDVHDDYDDDDVKINGSSIVCVKRREDVKWVEKVEDCFILEFDPSVDDSFNSHFSKFSICVKSEIVAFDEDLSILAEKGQVACRDYPHPRHLCATHPFKKTSHETHCKMCYCYVCDLPAPCKKWTLGKDFSLKHCDATPEIPLWELARLCMQMKD